MERIDLVIFGATGFTGKYAVQEVNRVSKEYKSLTWAIAGRSLSKMEKIIADLQSKTGDDLSKIKTIIADVSDPQSLNDMAKQAKVVINCCGPYRFYGEAVVKACVEEKTSHVDVSGEPSFMERMQLEYNDRAKEAGVYVVSACGYDSIPADMGVVFLQQNFKGTLNTAECYMRSSVPSEYQKFGGASIHYGTWESMVYGVAEMGELGPLRRQLYPTRVPQPLPKLLPRGTVHKSEVDGAWYIPFLGADRSVVNRSQRFFYDEEKKRIVQMQPYIGFPSLLVVIGILCFGLIFGIMTRFAFGRKMLLKHPRLFSFGFISHEGPAEEVMNNTKFWLTLCGTGWDEETKDTENTPPNKTVKVKVSGVNPGYGATVTTLVFSAITILKESNKMPGNGGVLPPGAAFAKTSLIEKLQKNNVSFEVMDDK